MMVRDARTVEADFGIPDRVESVKVNFDLMYGIPKDGIWERDGNFRQVCFRRLWIFLRAEAMLPSHVSAISGSALVGVYGIFAWFLHCLVKLETNNQPRGLSLQDRVLLIR
jgi:hypothetical protein